MATVAIHSQKYYDGEAIRYTGEYECLGSTPTGGPCPSVRTFKKAKGNKFPLCLKPHGDMSPVWLGSVPLSETDYRRLILGEWA